MPPRSRPPREVALEVSVDAPHGPLPLPREQAAAMRVAINGMFWHREHTGSGQYLRNLLPSLSDLTTSSSYVLFGPRPAPESQGAAQPSPEGGWLSRVLRTPFDRASENLAKVWFEQLAFPAACRQVRADVAHVPYFAPPLFPSVPTVVTIHDLIPLILPAYRASARVRAYMRLVSAGMHRAKVIVTDSDASARDIQRILQVPVHRLRVIHLAASSAFQPVAEAQRRPVLERLGLPEEYLLYLGGFDQRKNVPLLLEAYAAVRERLGGLPLVLAGRLPEQNSAFAPDPRPIVARLGLEDAVLLPGFVREEDKPALYAAATAFVFPSIYEGFGLPVLEAISCGTPAIVARDTALEEVAGPGGLLVPADDGAALASALVRVATDAHLRAELSAAGLEHAARFSWRRCAAQTLSAYEQAIRAAG